MRRGGARARCPLLRAGLELFAATFAHTPAQVCLHNDRFRAAIQPGSLVKFTWEGGVGQPGHVEDRLISWQADASVKLEVDTGAVVGSHRDCPGARQSQGACWAAVHVQAATPAAMLPH